MNIRPHAVMLLLLTAVFFGVCLLRSPDIFRYRLDAPALIERYLRSQDIIHEVPRRTFLSDSEIHIAAGYLYTGGADPTTYNFQHMPLVKYLYGASSRLLGSPFPVQIVFGLVFTIATYILGVMLFRSRYVGLWAGILVATDPVFNHLVSEALLDLPQATFLLAFLLLVFRGGRWGVPHGILIGCAAASKFWTPVAVVAVLACVYDCYRYRQWNWRGHAVATGIAGVTFYASYAVTALQQSVVTPIFYQGKIFKFWLNHSVSSLPGANIILFATGLTVQWWGEKGIIFSPYWSPLWPASLAGVITYIFRQCRSGLKVLQKPVVAALVFPVVYLFSLAIQAPFVRYFLLLLPFLYTGMVAILLRRDLPQPEDTGILQRTAGLVQR